MLRKYLKHIIGKIDVDLSTLPCLKKVSREKITANFDSDVLEAIRNLAEKHHVSYTSLMNDVLRKISQPVKCHDRAGHVKIDIALPLPHYAPLTSAPLTMPIVFDT